MEGNIFFSKKSPQPLKVGSLSHCLIGLLLFNPRLLHLRDFNPASVQVDSFRVIENQIRK